MITVEKINNLLQSSVPMYQRPDIIRDECVEVFNHFPKLSLREKFKIFATIIGMHGGGGGDEVSKESFQKVNAKDMEFSICKRRGRV